MRDKALPPTGRAFPSLANLANNLIFVIGGYEPGTEHIFTSVDKYVIQEDVWESAPCLNVPRAVHSSCSFGNSHIYTFCGFNGTDCLNSVERLDAIADN